MEDARAPVERRRTVAASAIALLLAGGTLVCCALPVLLVTLGLGSGVAALTAAAPWLVTLSHYKVWMFAAAMMALLAAGLLLYRPGRACPTDPELARACARLDVIARTFWWFGLSVWLVGAFVAFAWVPLQQAIARG